MLSLLRRLLIALSAAPTEAVDVSITVDASSSLGPYTPTYRFFGADEPNYAYYPDGRNLITELGKLGEAQTYFRTHNLLTTGDSVPALKWGSTNIYTEDADGNPIYNYTIVDHILDTYLERNVKPYLQIGFMPEALAVKPDPYKFVFDAHAEYNTIYTGWSHPPKDYNKWADLVYNWVCHCVSRYGTHEVSQWYFEVWNEPNIPYWNGTQSEFFHLHSSAVNAVRRAFPFACVGGPEIAGGPGDGWLYSFLNYAQTNNVPLDFISFHAKGDPRYIEDSNPHIRMNISAQLQNTDQAFGNISLFPSYSHLPIIIGEQDPDGCAACQTPAYNYRNGIFYPSFTIAAFIRAMDLSLKHAVNLQGSLTWAFEFEGNSSEFSYFDAFRTLSTNGITKPVLNAHRMLARLSGTRLNAASTGQYSLDTILNDSARGKTSDIGVLATLNNNTSELAVLVYNYHDDDLPRQPANISLSIANIPWTNGEATLLHYRIDNTHSNAYTTWLNMGSPQNPTQRQYAILRDAAELAMLHPPRAVNVSGGAVDASFELPIHGTSLVMIRR